MYIEKLKKATKKKNLLKPISELNKVTGYQVNM